MTVSMVLYKSDTPLSQPGKVDVKIAGRSYATPVIQQPVEFVTAAGLELKKLC